jgi:hypothetical protein
MNRGIVMVLALLAGICFSYRPAWSQAETGSIAGTVTDSTGAVIPGATVTPVFAADQQPHATVPVNGSVRSDISAM